jgi:hypothetical protein
MRRRCLDTPAKLALYNAEHPDRQMKLGDTVQERTVRSPPRRRGNLRPRRNIHAPLKEGRYGMAQRQVIDGHKFASKKEAERYCNLKLMAKAKMIQSLELQPKIPIIIKGVKIQMFSARYHETGRTLTYIADFKYYDNERGRWVIEDVKGHLTEVYKIKRALVKAMGITIDEV